MACPSDFGSLAFEVVFERLLLRRVISVRFRQNGAEVLAMDA